MAEKEELKAASTAKAVNDKNKDKELEELRAKAAADEKKAGDNKKAASGKPASSGKKTSGKGKSGTKSADKSLGGDLAAVAVTSLLGGSSGSSSQSGSVLGNIASSLVSDDDSSSSGGLLDSLTDALTGDDSSSGGKKKKKKKKKNVSSMLSTILIILLAIVVFFLFKDQILGFLGLGGANAGPEDVVGFQEVILGESREKQDFLVFEQDVEVSTTLSKSLLDLGVFTKTQTIISYGTGGYTVDMSGIDDAHIKVDKTDKTVTVTIPHAKLQYIDPDESKTEIGDTEGSFLTIGELKLTQQEQKVVDESVESAMEEKLLDEALLAKADEYAVLKSRELFQPLISAVDDEYIVRVVQE